MEFPAISQAKILIIDDDQDILNSLKAGLHIEQVELEIDTATTALEGVTKAQSFKPDIVILDLQLPDARGFDILDDLRSPELAETRIIMLTAQDTTNNLWESIDLKIDDFIGKPFDLAELEARIYSQLLLKHNS